MPGTKKTEPKKIGKVKQTESDIKADVYGMDGKVAGKISLPVKFFGAKVNSRLLSQIVRVHDANERLGTNTSKTRTEVTGSTRKIYRQKGTGRARHGDIKAPIFVGGGVAHGPRPRDYSLTLPKKMKKIALCSALTGKLQEGTCVFVKGLGEIEPKTKVIFQMLKNLNLLSKGEDLKRDLLLVMPQNIKNIILSGRNIPHLYLTSSKLLNAYEILKNHKVIFMEESVDALSAENVKEKIEEKLKPEKEKKTSKTGAVKEKAVKKTVKKTTAKKAVKKAKKS